MKRICVILGVLMCTSSCTHLASISTSSIPKNRDNKVSTQVKRFIFLGFNFNNDYVNEITFNLAEQCKGGRVQGVMTKHENVMYFPAFAHEVRVTAAGYCSKKI